LRSQLRNIVASARLGNLVTQCITPAGERTQYLSNLTYWFGGAASSSLVAETRWRRRSLAVDGRRIKRIHPWKVDASGKCEYAVQRTSRVQIESLPPVLDGALSERI
jgi:hypothetical protein